MATGTLIYGRDAKFRVSFNGAPWVLVVKSWRIQEQATEAADGVCGEQRDRLQIITNFYRCTLECNDDGSSRTFENFIQNQLNEDSQLPDLPLAAGQILTFRGIGGTRKAFMLKDCTRGPLDFNVPGRSAAAVHTISLRARQFSSVPAI